MLDATGRRPPSGERPFALIVPHAGYRFSGPVAASGYAETAPFARAIRRVALLGPAHFRALGGAAVSGADAWHTPLGSVAVDDELRRIALAAGAVVDDAPHEGEHALEVQLPWLQVSLGSDVRILPVAAGRWSARATADLLVAVGEMADLVVVSTDLSHDHPIEEARRRDRRTADAVLARDPEAIRSGDACGLFALRGMLELARRREGLVTLLDLRTSADVAGDARRVVGYGSFAVAGPR
jgi:AmmeMemoRadiSam system protein B